MILTSKLFISCAGDGPCDDRYAENEDGVCIPECYPDGEQNLHLGNTFYHSKFGEITYSDGQ